jgi:hypothetical protein
MEMFLFFCFCKRSSTRNIGCEYHWVLRTALSSFVARFYARETLCVKNILLHYKSLCAQKIFLRKFNVKQIREPRFMGVVRWVAGEGSGAD